MEGTTQIGREKERTKNTHETCKGNNPRQYHTGRANTDGDVDNIIVINVLKILFHETSILELKYFFCIESSYFKPKFTNHYYKISPTGKTSGLILKLQKEFEPKSEPVDDPEQSEQFSNDMKDTAKQTGLKAQASNKSAHESISQKNISGEEKVSETTTRYTLAMALFWISCAFVISLGTALLVYTLYLRRIQRTIE